MASLILDYDENTDVVRVRMDAPQPTVAVPTEDLTLLVSKYSMDHVVGIDIQDLPSFASRYISDQLLPRKAVGVELFTAAKPHLEKLAEFFLTNLGPHAKDHIVAWDSFVQRKLMGDRKPQL